MKEYNYHCAYCNNHWQEEREEEYKNAPCVMPCPKCGEYYVNRVRAAPNIIVPEGKCGNARDGYFGSTD